MTLKSSQNEESTKPMPVEPQAIAEDTIDASRRRFGRAGIAASGVLLTLASRPVLADCTITKSPSGYTSINTSSSTGGGVCNGYSPGYWKTHDGWPCDKNLKFSSVFLSCLPTSPYAKYTLYDLLDKKKDDKENLGMHLVAAFLNARAKYNTFLPEEDIFKMFAQWQANLYYSPKPGVQWDAKQIVDYLKGTMI